MCRRPLLLPGSDKSIITLLEIMTNPGEGGGGEGIMRERRASEGSNQLQQG